MNQPYSCKICGESNPGKTFIAKEMMFGLMDKFAYSECTRCGSIQLDDVPENMEKFYPADYVPFIVKRDLLGSAGDNPLARYLRHRRSEYVLKGKSLIGRLANAIRPAERLLFWLKKCKIDFDSKILDVGCGGGNLLLNMERLGFKDLLGMDPYIESDIRLGKNIEIRKNVLKNIDGEFDLIMMHHSLEHMSSPIEAFRDIARLLKKGGRAIVRTPVVPSYAWRFYGVNWVQLDAPRHIVIASLTGMEVLAQRSGLKIDETEFDSTELQFIGSEQYLKDIPLYSPKSYYTDPDRSIFSRNEVEIFKKRAAELNREKRGDQAVLYISRS